MQPIAHASDGIDVNMRVGTEEFAELTDEVVE